uniref:Uncharacterized protein n=1 Tax=Maylandia zebra TaxID=106582 RepID=A0A3P9B4J8_9CICH
TCRWYSTPERGEMERLGPDAPGPAGTPTGTAAEVIREKGPARVQSRRQPPPTASPRRPAFHTAADTAPRKPTPTTREAPRTRAPRGGPRTALPAAERGGRRSDCSPSRGASPAPLRTPLPCSNMPEAVHLGDLLRIWVRSGVRLTPSPPDFQGPARAHRTPPEPRRFPGHGPLSRGEPIPGRPALHKEKRTLPGAPASFSGFVCVTALGASRRLSPHLQVRGFEPDSLSIGRGRRRTSPRASERRSPIP